MYSSIYPQPTVIASNQKTPSIKFPEDLQIIIRNDLQTRGNLYLGNIEAAENKNMLETLKIGYLLSVAKGSQPKHGKDLIKNTKYIPLSENDDLTQYLQEGVSFITDSLSKGNVLVHCVAGTNRSACFVIAYLIRTRRLSLEDAYAEVKSRRKIICPTEAMIKQLKKYQKDTFGKVPQLLLNTSKKVDTSVRPASARQDTSSHRSRQKTNFLQPSQFLQNDEHNPLNISRVSAKIRIDDLDERRSQRSNRSCHDKSSTSFINIAINQPKDSGNPQQSFISRSKNPSVLNKSFYSYKSRQPEAQLPELTLQKKTSSSRQQFSAKIKRLDSRNSQINSRIEQIHQRFEQEHQQIRLNFQTQINEITQLRSSIYTQQNEQRKSRLTEKRSLHEKTMDNYPVQQYIAELPLATTVK